MRRTAILCVLTLLLSPAHVALAQGLTPPEQAELQAYKKRVPSLVEEIKDLSARIWECEAPSREDRQNYEKEYWKHQGELLKVEKSAYVWQNTAGSIVLGLVALITLSGILLAAYQLYLSFKIGQKIDAQTLDISAQKAQVTSGVVGITILVIAGIFLMIFLKEIYGIRYVVPPPSSGPEQKAATR